MSARWLLVLFDVTYLTALSIWVGGGSVCAWGLGPALERALGPEGAGRAARAFLHRFSIWGAAAGAIALASLVCGALAVPELRGPRIGAQALLLIVGILVLLFGGSSLPPAVPPAQRTEPAASKGPTLRQRPVWVPLTVIALGFMLLVAFALRSPPRTQGIIELTPQERAQRAAEALHRAQERFARPPGSSRENPPSAPNRPDGPTPARP